MTDALAAEVARLNSIEQVQTRLGIGRSMVFELIGSGKLRSVSIGRRRLVPETAIAEFIEALEAGG
jgi:excisionase family DNA binding protein